MLKDLLVILSPELPLSPIILSVHVVGGSICHSCEKFKINVKIQPCYQSSSVGQRLVSNVEEPVALGLDS